MRELRWAIRRLLRTPAFTIAAVATLSLGIGAAVVVFSALEAVVLRPLPYRDPGKLAFLWIDDVKRGIHEEGTTYPTYLDWKAQSRSFEDLALYGRGYEMTITGVAEPERVRAAVVTPSYFALLGVPPLLGRTFTDEEERAGEKVVVISHEVWQRRFGRNSAAIGASLQLDGAAWRVIGVMPERYTFPGRGDGVWVPALHFPPIDRMNTRRDADFFIVLGRLLPGVTFGGAQAEMKVIGDQLARIHPVSDPEFGGYTARVVPLNKQILGPRLPQTLWLLMGAVAFLLLVACVNIANLILARGASQQPELAVRAALGASFGALLRQQLTEGAVIAAAGGASALLLAIPALQVLPLMIPPDLPRFDTIAMNPAVFAFALAAAMTACLLFALAPAWRQAGTDVSFALRGSGRATDAVTSRLQGALITGEFAIAIVLVAGAGLFLRSLLAVRSVEPGFAVKNTLLFQTGRSASGAPGSGAVFFGELHRRIRTLPGVQASGAVGDFFIERNPDYVVMVEGGATDSSQQVTVDATGPGFLEASGVRLIRGRLLAESDYGGPPRAVVVNETFAKRFFPGRDAVGRRIWFSGTNPKNEWITIVGVVGDMHRRGLEREAVCEAFGPVIWSDADIIVRASVPPETLVPAIRAIVRQLDAGAFVYGVTTVERSLDRYSADRRLQVWLLGTFSLIALGLAAVGIFGVMQYLVSQRRREIGIRMALGARPGDVQADVVRRGLMRAFAGVVIGVTGAALLNRAFASLLYGVSPVDPITFAASALLLLAVAAGACWIPARSAAATDPAIALREQ